MKRVLVTAPASEPISLADMKDELRIAHDDDDAIISSFITAARIRAEHIMNRQLMSATYALYFDGEVDEITITMPPLVSIDAFQAYNGSAWNDVTDYVLDNKAEPAKVYINTWPTLDTSENAKNSVKIQYQAGYADADAVPEGIKAWIIYEVRKMYDEEPPRIGIDSILDSYRVVPV